MRDTYSSLTLLLCELVGQRALIVGSRGRCCGGAVRVGLDSRMLIAFCDGRFSVSSSVLLSGQLVSQLRIWSTPVMSTKMGAA